MAAELIEYLHTNGLQHLQDTFAIKAKRHPQYPNLVLLKYDQIESPMGERIVQQCRGIILDESNAWQPVCYPYTKFFNHGEGHAAPIDWDTARVYEKLDGSLMNLYHYDGKWHVASSGTPDAGGELWGSGRSLADMFWNAWDSLGYKMPLVNCCTYMFEFMSPWNRIVVRHEKPRIVLHGIRGIVSWKEHDLRSTSVHRGWECVRSFPLHSWASVVAAAVALDPMQTEGYVVCDANFNRVKIKCPAYVAIHHLKDGMSLKRIVDIVRGGETTEFTTYFPEFAAEFERVSNGYADLLARTECAYGNIEHLELHRDFALKATEHAFSGALFARRNGKTPSFETFYREMDASKLLEWMRLDRIGPAPTGETCLN